MADLTKRQRSVIRKASRAYVEVNSGTTNPKAVKSQVRAEKQALTRSVKRPGSLPAGTAKAVRKGAISAVRVTTTRAEAAGVKRVFANAHARAKEQRQAVKATRARGR